ncbi:pre-rRNA-processing protein pno1 [Orobanche gracilis]
MDVKAVAVPLLEKLSLEPLEAHEIFVPPHRYAPLEEAWLEISTPFDEDMKIDIRLNAAARRVDLRAARADTPDAVSNLPKSADCVRAFLVGFSANLATTILRIDGLCVKTMKGDLLYRRIGRLKRKWGKLGGPELTIDEVQRTMKVAIVYADSRIHIFGLPADIKRASSMLRGLIFGFTSHRGY